MKPLSQHEETLAELETQILLFAPIYLKVLKDQMIKKAQQMREDGELRCAWRSLSQPNWLAEVAARALSVSDIVEHLDGQGRRWADVDKKLPLHEQIRRVIDDQLRPQVKNALENAGADVLIYREESDRAWQPSAAQISAAQLDLAREFINALVTWRRIEEVNPKQKEGEG